LSSARRAESRTPPLSVVQAPQLAAQLATQMRTGTDNLPILNQPMQTGQGTAGDYTGLNTPSVWRNARSQAAAKVEALSSNGMDEIEIPAFLRKQAD
jgi:cell division protein FtsZ